MGPSRGLGRPRRLKSVDYTSCGEYFVTTVVHDRSLLFGTVEDGVVRLSPAGEAVRQTWLSLPGRFPFVHLDESVVMPNHFHGILAFLPEDAMGDGARACALGRLHLDAVLQVFKSASAVEVNRALGRTGRPVWQPGYFEHVVRSDRSLEAIRAYIQGNPAAWPRDRYHG